MNYHNMTIIELKRYCKEHNIKGYSNKRKNEIINLIKSNSKLNVLDLFCGCGGMTYGLSKILFAV